jgi:hypothetical protein
MTLALLNDHMAHTSNSVWLELVLIVGALAIVALLIGVVWRVAAKLGSRVPGRNPEPLPMSESTDATKRPRGRAPRRGREVER